MTPRKNVSEKNILFIHGGGYIYEMANMHWWFINKLCRKTNATIYIPIYPLAPKYNHSDIFAMIQPLYLEILEKSKPEDITIIGDSAGGGLTLAVVEWLKVKGVPQPKDAILISPLLDMSLSNPQMYKLVKHDLIIGIPALKALAEWYVGDSTTENYLISPINGSFEGLCKISLFIGTHDILYPDTKRLNNKLRKMNVKFDYYVFPKMIHDWALLPIPEGKAAINKICEIIG